MAFFDRTDELAALEDRWDRGRAELYILWGRRRVGKTELLSRFLDGRRGLLFEATRGLEADHLADLSALIADVTGRRLLAEQPLSSWPAALAAIEEYAERERTLVVFDEFQWIAQATPEVGSQINRWWRVRGRKLPVFLILSGSEVSFFERKVLAGSMYGRRTGQQQLRPFGYRDASLFFPSYSPEDRIRAYAVCGGMPYYLEQLDPGRSLGENVLRAILYRDGVLHEEAQLLLHEQLPDPMRYFSLLRAIQNGSTRFNEIVQRTRLDAAFVHTALKLLQELQLVRRVHPVTVANPERTRQTYYAIADGYLRFYFSFVHPFESRLQTRASAKRHLAETVLPRLDRFVSKPAFEEVARGYLREAEDAADVGGWWGHVRTGRQSEVREVDVVAIDADRRVQALGACKWTNEPLGADQHRLLTRLAPSVPGTSDETRHYFFSRSGFDPELTALAEAAPGRIRLLAPADLF